MRITDELRKYARGYETLVNHKLLKIADRIDAEHEAKVAYWQGASYKDGYDEGFASADDWLAQHEDAMAEHGWVRGPLDADDKMWRRGDMSDSNWGVIEGIAYEDGRWFVSGHDTGAPWVPADSIRHYHEPTVEDVLLEACKAYHGLMVESMSDAVHDMPAPSEVIAKYAAKLQLKED